MSQHATRAVTSPRILPTDFPLQTLFLSYGSLSLYYSDYSQRVPEARWGRAWTPALCRTVSKSAYVTLDGLRSGRAETVALSTMSCSTDRNSCIVCEQ